jgi:hypothetical protein
MVRCSLRARNYHRISRNHLSSGATVKYKTPVRQAPEQNRITLEVVVPEILGPDPNSAEPQSVVPSIEENIALKSKIATLQFTARYNYISSGHVEFCGSSRA